MHIQTYSATSSLSKICYQEPSLNKLGVFYLFTTRDSLGKKQATNGIYCSRLRASSYEPGNRAGPVGGTNFVFCSYGKFNPGYRDEKCPKGHQNTRGTAFRPVSDLTSHAQLKMFRPGIRAGVFIWEEFEKCPARLPGQGPVSRKSR